MLIDEPTECEHAATMSVNEPNAAATYGVERERFELMMDVSGEGRNWDLQQVDVQQTIAWKNGYFVFERADLATVMRQLARWYDIDVHFDGGARRLFGGEMKMDMPLSGVLRLFEKGGIHFSRNGNQITIKE